jgi:hypothetical protein
MSKYKIKDKVKVVHSQTKSAWNIIGTTIGMHYKYARIPYYSDDKFPEITSEYRKTAYDLAASIVEFLNKE